MNHRTAIVYAVLILAIGWAGWQASRSARLPDDRDGAHSTARSAIPPEPRLSGVAVPFAADRERGRPGCEGEEGWGEVLEAMVGDGWAQLAPATRARLMQACQCAEFIERQKAGFPSTSFGSEIDGLQRHLFLNDYVYASHLDPCLESGRAEAAYAILIHHLRRRLYGPD